MKLTLAVKQWLIANCGVKQDATDDEFRKAAGEALATAKLSTDEFIKLQAEPKETEAGELSQKLTVVATQLEKLIVGLTAKPPEPDKATEAKPKETTPVVGAIDKQIAAGGEVRVKGAWERYDGTKSGMVYPSQTKSGKPHPLAGKPVMDATERGRPIDNPSELDRAVAGAFGKFLVAMAQRRNSRTFGYQALPEHDRELLDYARDKMLWGGDSKGRDDFEDISHRQLTPSESKAVIDDATSGGLEAAPIVFDDQVIQAPLLHGELFPLVNVVPLDRGRRVEGVSTGKVTGSWGGVDDTAVTLFTTTSYVSAFDTTIYRWEGAIRVGLDFLSDTPIDFGQHLTAQYGERLLEDLDDVIAAGNGTTQPEGVINKSGITSVAWGGSTTIGNYESLRFTVTKQEHAAAPNTAVFCGTLTSYQRARALAVGASDARRLMGYDYGSYSWMEHPYKINASLTNAQIWFAVLSRYRMYRRRGLTIRTSTEGDTLIRANEMVIVALARFGGQLERAACGAITTTAPA